MFREIRDFEELKDQYPETLYFVGSGGLKGIVHPQVFKGNNQINDAIRHAVEVKYKAIGETRALNKITELPGVLSYANHTVSEYVYVGHLKEELTPVSLRIFIDEATHYSMRNATFKNPYTLADTNKIPAALFKTISTYLNGRQHLASEKIAPESLKISTITLSIYASKYFCTQADGKTVFQIGEEGFACPFYRSFNDNASCIPFFTKAVKALFENRRIKAETTVSSSLFKISVADEDPLEYYQKNVQTLVNSEIRTIHLLNFGLDMVESSVGSSQIAPQITGYKLNFQGERGKAFLESEQEENRNTNIEKTSSKPCFLFLKYIFAMAVLGEI